MPGAYQRSMFVAAIFPEVAALAAVLAAPPGTDSHDVSDALPIRARARQAGRFVRPASAYAHTSHYDDGTPRITDGRHTAERRTATRFRRDRRAPLIPSPGLPMPCACRSGPPPSSPQELLRSCSASRL
jgi:hypothetical protein